MVAHGRVELLAHPLSQKYLQMKWNAYGKYFHLVNLLLYTVFLALVTFFAAELMEIQDQMEELEDREGHTSSPAADNNTAQPSFLKEVGTEQEM
ncbi:hypothetical protein PR048_021721 [Dryococelus australis]|uniref:Uncharacterized protein n=1 Tax=Dryococelus australis TaxID=614101 RepID=A0ABQ9GZ36_9NEOP|nr:hypothetical protein PR048_021721 [Dryococelus australis]